MECPRGKSTYIRKNGKNKGKQNHIRGNRVRQVIDEYEETREDSDENKLSNNVGQWNRISRY